MDVKGFQAWLSAASGLTRAQRREGEASKAAIELGLDEARRCPHCAGYWIHTFPAISYPSWMALN